MTSSLRGVGKKGHPPDLAIIKYVQDQPAELYAIDPTGAHADELIGHFPAIAGGTLSIATAPDGYIYYVLHKPGFTAQFSGTYIARMPSDHMTTIAGDADIVYAYPVPDAMNYVAVRPSTDPDGYRIYSSAIVDGQTHRCSIFYLDPVSRVAMEYVTLSGSDLPAGPCGQQWAGQFAFSNDTLYLTSATTPTVIFRLSGAGLTQVTGTPEYVYPPCELETPPTVCDQLVCDTRRWCISWVATPPMHLATTTRRSVAST